MDRHEYEFSTSVPFAADKRAAVEACIRTGRRDHVSAVVDADRVIVTDDGTACEGEAAVKAACSLILAIAIAAELTAPLGFTFSRREVRCGVDAYSGGCAICESLGLGLGTFDILQASEVLSARLSDVRASAAAGPSPAG